MLKTLSLALCVLIVSSTHAASIKKWVDENGVTHYGTTIPPQYVQKEHSELNKRGIEVRRNSAAKTPEEVAREKELERLRLEKRRLIEEQNARDQILLNMYRSDEDLLMVRDGKLAQIDSQIKLKQGQLKRLKRTLAKQQEHAAQLERQGKEVDVQLQSNLDVTEKHIENAYATMLAKEQEKNQIRGKYNHDLKRLRELRSGKTTNVVIEEPADLQRQTMAGLFYCEANGCNSAWSKAISYAMQHATTEPSLSSSSIWISKPAIKNHDISVTLARITDKNGDEKIFLDLSCADTASGRKYCASEQVKAIKNNFIQAMSTE